MTIAVLSFSQIAKDQRVLRQCSLLQEMGYLPVVIGFGDETDDIGIPVLHWPTPSPSVRRRLGTLCRQLPAHFSSMAADAGFWLAPEHRWALGMLRRHRVAIVIANDWPALVIAARYKREAACVVHYDAHEFATQEFDESAWWRFVHKPSVCRLERAAIKEADSVSTVGPSLAKALQSKYGLESAPIVIRNLPKQPAINIHPISTWPLRILYHGNLVPNRGLEELISAAGLWSVPHSVTLRGASDPSFSSSLKRRIRLLGLQERVFLEAPVPPNEVISKAAQTADCGVFFTPLTTIQRRFTLPNKLFEYIAAGLSIIVSPAPDMRDIVSNYNIGVTTADASAESIASAVNSLDPMEIVMFKNNAQAAARELIWENEKLVLKEAFSALLQRTRIHAAN